MGTIYISVFVSRIRSCCWMALSYNLNVFMDKNQIDIGQLLVFNVFIAIIIPLSRGNFQSNDQQI